MISISHSQAQRLIRGSLDRPAPEEQWNALQAHLEGCADCRAYRDQRLLVEKNLRRGLRARWLATGEPDPGLGFLLNERLHARSQRRGAFAYAGLALVMVLLLAAFLSSRGQPDGEGSGGAGELAAAAPPQPTATAQPTPTALMADGLFQGVLAFEAAPEGISDIFLFEANPAGTELTNLTDHPGRDFEPAWSPDGNWIAFLSNRDRGALGGGIGPGADIYVISVAGTRLTRLTLDPTLTWSGPLAWSPDGRWIAATGTRLQMLKGSVSDSERWIYRVNLDGTAPRALPHSRGASLPRFSPELPLLAYLAEDEQLSFLRVYDARSGRTHDVVRGESAQGGPLGPGASVVSNFDWAADGQTILYTSVRAFPERDPAQMHLRLVDISRQIEDLPETINTIRRSSRVLGIFPTFAPVVSAGLTADNTLLYSRSYWRGGRGPACRPLESAPRAGLDDLLLPDLCVESAIERAAWSTDGRWLVVSGQSGEAGDPLADEEVPGIYALGLPDRGPRILQVERLYDMPAASKALRLRPDRPSAAMQPIDPRPARRVVLELPAIPPRALLERALISLPNPAGSNLARLRPDGSGIASLNAEPTAACPRGMPGGGPVAFTIIAQDSDVNSSDIYVLDEAGGRARRITRLIKFPEPTAQQRIEHPLTGQYACPVWSPDGSQLAAWVDTGSQSYLALIPAEGAWYDRVARYLPLNAPSPRPQPLWSADGQRLLLFLKPDGQRGPGSGTADLSSLDVKTGRVTRLASAPGWSSASQAALAPGGEWLAYTTLNYSISGQMQASLRLINLKTRQNGAIVRLPSYDPLEIAGGFSSRGYSSREYGSLAWLDDEHLGLVFRGSQDGQVPPALLVYDLPSGGLVTLTGPEEELVSAAWSPEGSWVLYSTPSGLWSLNVNGALARRTAPMWLTSEVAYEINWQ